MNTRASSGPLVSILIPAFNAGRWIEQAIRSALGQTCRRKEVIVVDDGSTDNTLYVAKSFCAGNVLVVRKDNEGAAATRNRAMALCQGDYIQWLDADDLLAPNKVERQLDLLRDDPDPQVLLSGAWGSFGYRPQRACFNPSSLWNDLTPLEWLVRKLGQNLHMQTATWLTSRQLADAAGLWDTRMQYDDDGEYFCRVLLASKGTRFAGAARVYWRDVPGARLSYIGTSNRKMDSLLLSMKLHIQCLRSLEDSLRVREACRAYIQNCAMSFHPDRVDIRNELQEMARDLGGEMQLAGLLKPLFGEAFAWRAQLTLPHFKARALCELGRWMRGFDAQSDSRRLQSVVDE
jgi:glycosyltransferase involved in cell wall biosynthesis